ncbi:MAG: hypothetical protein AAF533_21135 [Acidobacteriota bacterium]
MSVDWRHSTDWLKVVGLSPTDTPALAERAVASAHRLREARTAVAALLPPESAGLAAWAVGSLGRMEHADAVSDLDLVTVHDPGVVDEAGALELHDALAEPLRGAGFEVSEKTFAEPLSIDELVENIGGTNDSNRRLTYRALLLTEGAPLHDAATCAAFRDRILASYRSGPARGRSLISLSNDLHRYYRTICVDYRYKVEEAGKSWALRNLKLRHSRKLWHLAMLALQCAGQDHLRAGDQEAHDAWVLGHLDLPPARKLVLAMNDLGHADACTEILRRFDAFLAGISSPELRGLLENLEPGGEKEQPLVAQLFENARGFDEAAAQVVDVLLEVKRRFVVRFHLL